MAVVRLPAAWAPWAAGQREIPVDAPTIGAALRALTEQHPHLHRRVFTEQGRIGSYVNVYLGDTDLRSLEGGLATPLDEGDTLMIVPALAGG
ncbi:MoaD/ThiS family protein [Streptomyces rubellomurinus]|uniref:Thiamine biosynthesis protein ThiS n=1 Tax=Streptomyces rubellomurinus (strain ATCC 31215) TaxID=359131 RepID=A0A0F2T6S8_STRR3|nr:MoaD/ThiS family protein [Streptomyces rubellomurinus]KJS58020.1 hypothetical protein VM95_35990 [Streptomyces rubellomurinus]